MNIEKYLRACRNVAAEGCVLLENDGTLPLLKTDKVAIFGREQFEYIKSGSGSGGSVQCEYVTDINSCLREEVEIDEQLEKFYKDFIKDNPYDFGTGWPVPAVQKQPEISEELVKSVAERCNKALVVVSRSFGEGFDMHAAKGEFLLTDAENRAFDLICKHFKRVAVVVNSGNLIDLSWVKKRKIGGLLLVWQGGQEGGAAATDVLIGKVSPSGKLPVSVADYSAYEKIPFGDDKRNIHVEDIYVGYRYLLTFCPNKIIYPFGYGLSYTNFKTEITDFSIIDNKILITAEVKNVGSRAGREVVQIYFSAPQGKLGKAKKELIAFKKTQNIEPNCSQTLKIEFEAEKMRAFDDKNACGFGSAFVLEKGDYGIFAGTDCLNCKKIGVYSLENNVCVQKTTSALHPVQPFMRITTFGKEKVEALPREDFTEKLEEIAYSGDKGITLKNVADGVCDINEFIAQFMPDRLACLVKGEGWGSSKASVAGSAGVAGGITDCLKKHGVPVITLCDGPSGLRSTDQTNFVCIPTGVTIAATWDPEIIAEIFQGFSEELKSSRIDVILAPGMNIHRHPFGGRNFEYFSEDPYLTGVFTAAECKYFYDNGIIATPKHFAVNSQETGRDGENEVLSERALREIYLKPFETAVKAGGVHAIMTSYNRINGLTACSNAGLTDVILRREWGYNGLVMSDWWARADKFSDGTFGVKNISQMIKAQNDIFMVAANALENDDDILEELENGGLSLAELQRSAKRTLELVMKTQSFKNPAPDEKAKNKVLYTLEVKNNAVKAAGSGKFTAEAVYYTAEGGLNQLNVSVYINGIKQAAFTAPQTAGKLSCARFSSQAKYDDEITFEKNVTVTQLKILCE